MNNPYDVLIQSCDNDPIKIQNHYDEHRRTRNAKQRAKLLDPAFAGVEIDPILHRLVNKSTYPDYTDPRHCLVFWARPTQPIKDLIQQVQAKLKDIAPNLWLMPPNNQHMTVLELTHSRRADELPPRLAQLGTSVLETITDYTYTHRTRLEKPMLSYDATAMALSFLPSSSSAAASDGEGYTYHHLRRDIYGLCAGAGVEVDSRYVLPSAHLTVARFVSEEDTGSLVGAGSDGDGEQQVKPDGAKMEALIERIEEINRWLESKFWGPEGAWVVGTEKGIDCQMGTLWYGDGQRVRLGKGF